jgi:8-oxo-dGTP pyrophosphatase MutT (NUDIX family)
VSDWLARARALAAAEPARPREPLYVAQGDELHRVGSIEPSLAARLIDVRAPLRPHADGYVVAGVIDTALAAIAASLRDQGFAGAWRGELLSVVDGHGRMLGAIERAVVRALGLTTFAVHLVGHSDDERRTWVQQRAFDKSTDPGLWDTLMGGQVAHGESFETTLERETMEEAGLAIADLRGLIRCEPLAICRPVGEGYMVEHIEVYRARLPDGLVPANRDGEVETFDCLDDDALRKQLAAGAFTLEASLILAAELERRVSVSPG